MLHKALKESQRDLLKALAHLEATRMTRPDDPNLSKLKDNIRRAIKGKPGRNRSSRVVE
jgi:hypothetical protein